MRIVDDKNFQDEILHTISILPAQQKEPYYKFLALPEKIFQEILREQHA